MNRTRIFDTLAAAVAVFAVVGLAVVTRPQETPTRAVTTPVVAVDPTRSSPTAPTALFVGDSYTKSTKLAEMSYPCSAARRMGWICTLAAEPGTGYISGGSANRFEREYFGPSTSIVERIPQLAKQYRPDYVILDGGRNDTFAPREDTFNAMVTAIESSRRAWPNATLIFVRPRFLTQPDDDLGYDDEFIERLRGQPQATGMLIIDPIASLIGQDTSQMLQDDLKHPNSEGEATLASALTNALLSNNIAATA